MVRKRGVILLVTVVCVGFLAVPWSEAFYHRTSAPQEKAKPPGDGAAVSIVTPKDGAVLTSPPVAVEYTYTKGSQGDHVHVYLNGKYLEAYTGKSPLKLEKVTAGSHRLELRAATKTHDEFGPRTAVAFEIREGAAGTTR